MADTLVIIDEMTNKLNWAVCWVSFVFAIKRSFPALIFTVHFTAVSERAQLCWDGHCGVCDAIACSSGMSESSWASPTAFKHSSNCFPEAHFFTILWHRREQRERSWSEMTDTLDGSELIYRGKYSLQVKNKENKSPVDCLEAFSVSWR